MVAVTSRAGAFLFGSKFRSGRVRHALTGWSLLLLSLLFLSGTFKTLAGGATNAFVALA